MFHDFLNKKPGRASRSTAAGLLLEGLTTNMPFEKFLKKSRRSREETDDGHLFSPL